MNKTLLFLGLLFSVSLGLFSQTNISGVINSYTPLSGQDLTNNTVTVGSTAGIAVGDSVLLIQMQGAVIDSANGATFGNISAINSAGKYEVAVVCNIIGTKLQFDHSLLNTYDTTGGAQLVTIPSYGNVTVNGRLTCSQWNGSTGGVLIFASSGTVTLSANIDVDYKGFRGGTPGTDASSCTFVDDNNDYHYPNFTNGGQKGEGIAKYLTTKSYGRGKQANGGGGGNDHNAGGGGGGNVSAGGLGGFNDEPGTFNCPGDYAGVGGLGLSGTNTIFLGGGGGTGHGNNGETTTGGNGGGIVIILANSIAGGGNAISAQGMDVDSVNAEQADGDGAGGGGAGGSIQVVASSMTGTLSLDVSGGEGGTTDNENQNRCFGPGGGGAGGEVLISLASLPVGSSTDLLGGDAGVVRRSTNTCIGSSNGGLDGTAGSLSTGASVPMSVTDFTGCTLPVELTRFKAYNSNAEVVLDWETASEFNNAYFQIECSSNGLDFEAIGTVAGRGTYSGFSLYSFIDEQPLEGTSYYRLRQVDYDGRFQFSQIRSVTRGAELLTLSTLENPVREKIQIKASSKRPGAYMVEIHNSNGQVVLSRSVKLDITGKKLDFDLTSLSPGSYSIRIQGQGDQQVQRFILL